MSVAHTVRAADGGNATFPDYTRGFAIHAHCSECMGWEGNPRDCTATRCALYPFRGMTHRTREASKVPSTGRKSTLEAVGTQAEGADSFPIL
jgi:hypothetical protein